MIIYLNINFMIKYESILVSMNYWYYNVVSLPCLGQHYISFLLRDELSARELIK